MARVFPTRMTWVVGEDTSITYLLTPRRQLRRRNGSRRSASMPSPLLPTCRCRPGSGETPSRMRAGTPSSHGGRTGPISRPSRASGRHGPSSRLPLLLDMASWLHRFSVLNLNSCWKSEAERTILLVAGAPSPASRSAFSLISTPAWPGQ